MHKQTTLKQQIMPMNQFNGIRSDTQTDTQTDTQKLELTINFNNYA